MKKSRFSCEFFYHENSNVKSYENLFSELWLKMKTHIYIKIKEMKNNCNSETKSSEMKHKPIKLCESCASYYLCEELV